MHLRFYSRFALCSLAVPQVLLLSYVHAVRADIVPTLDFVALTDVLERARKFLNSRSLRGNLIPRAHSEYREMRVYEKETPRFRWHLSVISP